MRRIGYTVTTPRTFLTISVTYLIYSLLVLLLSLCKMTFANTSWKNDSEQVSISNKEQLISINFQDIPIRQALYHLGQHSQFNIVVSDTVSGQLSIRLEDVTWQQALDSILNIKRLTKKAVGNIILISPRLEPQTASKLDSENKQLAEARSKVATEVITINHAKAAELAKVLGGKVGVITQLGRITADSRTNSLLVSDVIENMPTIRFAIAKLDIPVKQVEIEARIVTVNRGNIKDLGVRWGLNSNSGSVRVGGSIEANGDSAQLADGELDVRNLLNVNLGATSERSASIAFQVARLASDTLLDLELSALQSESKAEIIATPKLLTTNKQSAYIEQGTEIPYLEAASSGATSVSYKKAVLSLKVTPQITSDNKLILDLSVSQDRPGDVVRTGDGESVAIDTQRLGTQVLVNDGETIVLGGIFQHTAINTIQKVPLLGDIPYLGALFRNSYERLTKRELLIFVTPKVLLP